MPIYEYECIPNKHRFEVIQKFDDAVVTHCTVCGEPVQKLLSSPAIQFKGTGWYVTDYARKGREEPSTEKSSPAKVETTKGEGSDEKSGKSSSDAK